MKKRTQLERLTIAAELVSAVLEEVYNGKAENILQTAVDIQIDTNRLVFELNRRNNAK